MQHPIRAAAIVVRDNRLLLVSEELDGVDPFWVPPGGGIEGEESIFDAAVREVYEETRDMVKLDRLVYVREYVDRVIRSHEAEFFILAADSSGDPRAERKAPTRTGEYFKREARFFSRAELQGVAVYPEMLESEFWDDLKAGSPSVRYLGMSTYGR